MNSIEANTTAILLPLPFDYAFDYQISKDNDLKMGEFVLVPFGKREVVGVVWGKANSGISDKKWVNQNPESHNFAIFCYPKE